MTNKVNAISAKKDKFNKNGEVVQARMYAYKCDLICIVKNTHPKYDRVESQEIAFDSGGR